MATTIFLVRHASHDLLGRVLAGRAAGVHLNERGRAESARLAERLSRCRVSAVHTSPLERARETAEAIAGRHRLAPRVTGALGEIDFGAWSGMRFDALAGDRDWERWNRARATARPPGGESMLEVQHRIVGHIEAVRRDHDGGAVALVSHGDVIKSALAFYLGLGLDAIDRFEVSPASISTIVAGRHGANVFGMNEVVEG